MFPHKLQTSAFSAVYAASTVRGNSFDPASDVKRDHDAVSVLPINCEGLRLSEFAKKPINLSCIRSQLQTKTLSLRQVYVARDHETVSVQHEHYESNYCAVRVAQHGELQLCSQNYYETTILYPHGSDCTR